MLTLYYAPGACSMAAHIVLEESGEKYQPQQLDLAKGEQRSQESAGARACIKQIDGVLSGREWIPDRYSVLDPYGFVFYTWGVRRELPMGELAKGTDAEASSGATRRGARKDQNLIDRALFYSAGRGERPPESLVGE